MEQKGTFLLALRVCVELIKGCMNLYLARNEWCAASVHVCPTACLVYSVQM